ncbi:hypothetical protein ARMSODRAFT_973768 [Armillaria solidipes]|uniref:Heterokaryon incompatibility domain-containing protein n=1 Tax=Armillaria solidipes TaxID=1076256 RepID=A0A2H3BKE1_9AGAR|nr:hypothetical protein ARMSODRAFT_973768 [Armillaria solidipes]
MTWRLDGREKNEYKLSICVEIWTIVGQNESSRRVLTGLTQSDSSGVKNTEKTTIFYLTTQDTVRLRSSISMSWEAQNEDCFMKEPFSFLYETPTWKQMRHQYHQHRKKNQSNCQWCKLIFWTILEQYHSNSFIEGGAQMHNNKKFKIEVCFCKETLYLPHLVHGSWLSLMLRAFEGDLETEESLFGIYTAHDCKDPNYPCLFISNGIEANYTVLSYVWGCKSQPYCTTTQNLESYINGIPLANIPKTIIDAITDSKDDKAQEIKKIWYIFCDAYIAIIAACADSVNDGFLHVRSEKTKSWSLGEIISLPFLCPDGKIGTIQVQKEDNALLPPISERAWCLEECMLPQCKLIYAPHTLLYECHTKLVDIKGSIDSVWLEWTSNLPNLISVPDQALPNSNSSALSNTFKKFGQIANTLLAYGHTSFLKAYCGVLALLLNPDHKDSGVEDFHGPQSRDYSMVYLEDMDEGQDYKYAVTNGCLILDAILWQAVWDPVQEVLTDVASIRTYHSAKISPLVSGKGVTEHGIGTEICGEIYLVIVTASSEGLVGLILVPATNKIINTQEDAYTDSFHCVVTHCTYISIAFNCKNLYLLLLFQYGQSHELYHHLVPSASPTHLRRLLDPHESKVKPYKKCQATCLDSIK